MQMILQRAVGDTAGATYESALATATPHGL